MVTGMVMVGVTMMDGGGGGSDGAPGNGGSDYDGGGGLGGPSLSAELARSGWQSLMPLSVRTSQRHQEHTGS